MYVSRAVQSIREDPIPGEAVTLLVTPADDTAIRPDLERVLDDCGGRLEGELDFGTLAVTVPQETVDAVCEVDGVETVETDATLSVTLDGAGEDVDYEE